MKKKIMKLLKENKKVIISTGIILLIVLCIFGITRCANNPLRGKEKFDEVYFDKPEGTKEVKKDKGTIGSAKTKWNSVKYSSDDIIFTIIHYEKRSVKYGVAQSEDNLKEKKINGVKYYYAKVKIDDTHSINRYYTQVGEDTYFVSVVSTNNDKNQKKIDDFVDSIVFKQ